MAARRTWLAGIGYSVTANGLSIIVSVVSTLLIPRFFLEDVGAYGLFQIYMFYVPYVVIFQFGWCEGLYLRDGGKSYQEIDRNLYSAHIRLLLSFEVILGVIIWALSLLVGLDGATRAIVIALIVDVVVCCWRQLFLNVLQATNRFRDFFLVTLYSRAFYVVWVGAVLLWAPRNFMWFVVGDVASRILSTLHCTYVCRELVSARPTRLADAIRDALQNVRAGGMLLAALLLGTLVVGIVRFGVQLGWDAATYGRVSLVLNLTNVLLALVSAVAMVLYPLLRRVSDENIVGYYRALRYLAVMPIAFLLLFSEPAVVLLQKWLPTFSGMLSYAVLLLPYCLYASKVTLVFLTVLKVVRGERQILAMHLLGAAVAVLFTVIGVAVWHNVLLTLLGIVASAVMMAFYGEFQLARRLDRPVLREALNELGVMAVFVLGVWWIGGPLGTAIYGLAFVYLGWSRRADQALVYQMIRGKLFPQERRAA